MSKRFGRNQRRKMREHVAALTRGIESATMTIAEERRHSSELRARLNIWARDILQLMGRDSAFNEQVRRIMSTHDIASLGGRLQLESPSLSFGMGLAKPEDVPTRITTYAVITAAIWRLHLSKDEFSELVRIQLENEQSQPVGYVLSYNHRWTDRDVQYIAEGIARELTALLNKGKKHD